MGKPRRNPQKDRREENLFYNENPIGQHRKDRKYRGKTTQEQRDTFLIEQVVNPHKNPYVESVTFRQIAKEKGIKKISDVLRTLKV